MCKWIEAVEFLEENPNVDLVSLDVIMPEMDGIECYRKIRTMGLGVRAVIISALQVSLALFILLKNEIKSSHFLSKELLEDELEDVVNFVLADKPQPLQQVNFLKKIKKKQKRLNSLFLYTIPSLASTSLKSSQPTLSYDPGIVFDFI